MPGRNRHLNFETRLDRPAGKTSSLGRFSERYRDRQRPYRRHVNYAIVVAHSHFFFCPTQFPYHDCNLIPIHCQHKHRTVASIEEPVNSMKNTKHPNDLFWKGTIPAEHNSTTSRSKKQAPKPSNTYRNSSPRAGPTKSRAASPPQTSPVSSPTIWSPNPAILPGWNSPSQTSTNTSCTSPSSSHKRPTSSARKTPPPSKPPPSTRYKSPLCTSHLYRIWIGRKNLNARYGCKITVVSNYLSHTVGCHRL